MAQRFPAEMSASAKIRAVRDAYLMATPDKTDTAYAALSSAADDLDAAVAGLKVAQAELNRLGNLVWKDTRTAAFDAMPIAQALSVVDAALAKAAGQAVPA